MSNENGVSPLYTIHEALEVARGYLEADGVELSIPGGNEEQGSFILKFKSPLGAKFEYLAGMECTGSPQADAAIIINEVRNIMSSANLYPTVGDYVLITTEYRGVFAGEVGAYDIESKTVRLLRGRNAIRFGTTGGFLQLAATGPTGSSQIGSPADVTLMGVTSISAVTDKAKKAWIDAPVSNG